MLRKGTACIAQARTSRMYAYTQTHVCVLRRYMLRKDSEGLLTKDINEQYKQAQAKMLHSHKDKPYGGTGAAITGAQAGAAATLGAQV